VVHLARCAIQYLHNTDASDMNNARSWSLPSLSLWVFLVLIKLGLTCTSACLYWILVFTVAKHDTNSTNDAFDFSIFWTCTLKATRNDWKCLNALNRVISEFAKKRFRTTVGLSMAWSVNLKLGTFEAFLAS